MDFIIRKSKLEVMTWLDNRDDRLTFDIESLFKCQNQIPMGFSQLSANFLDSNSETQIPHENSNLYRTF